MKATDRRGINVDLDAYLKAGVGLSAGVRALLKFHRNKSSNAIMNYKCEQQILYVAYS